MEFSSLQVPSWSLPIPVAMTMNPDSIRSDHCVVVSVFSSRRIYCLNQDANKSMALKRLPNEKKYMFGSPMLNSSLVESITRSLRFLKADVPIKVAIPIMIHEIKFKKIRTVSVHCFTFFHEQQVDVTTPAIESTIVGA